MELIYYGDLLSTIRLPIKHCLVLSCLESAAPPPPTPLSEGLDPLLK